MRILIIPPKGDNIHPHDTCSMWDTMDKYLWRSFSCSSPQELSEQGMAIITDGEGLKKGLEYNENLYPFFHVGTALIVGIEKDHFGGLTYNQIEFAKRWLERLKLEY